MNNKAKLIVEQNRLVQYNTNHIFHFIFTILTGGIWIPIWILFSISNGIERSRAIHRINNLLGE